MLFEIPCACQKGASVLSFYVSFWLLLYIACHNAFIFANRHEEAYVVIVYSTVIFFSFFERRPVTIV